MKSLFLSNCGVGNARLHSILFVVLLTVLPLLALGSVPGPVTGSLGLCVGSVNTLGNTVAGGTWTSSNISIATINASSGEVTGILAGTAIISYTNGDGQATAIVTVYPLPAPVTGPSAFCTGGTITLSNATAGGTWSNHGVSTIATVSAGTGIVTGVGPGVAAITYTAGGCTVSKMVTVQAALSAGTFTILNNDHIITTIAGTGTHGSSGDGGPATDAELYYPSNIIVEPSGNIYVAESNRIRKIDTAGIISTIAGNGDESSEGEGIPATDASLYAIGQMAMDGAGNLYVTEYYGGIRKISTSGIITSVTSPGNPNGLAISTFGDIYVSDAGAGKIKKKGASGYTTIAGTGVEGDNGDGIPATAANLSTPANLLIDPAGNICFSSPDGHRISRIDPAGIMHNFIGNGINANTEEGIAATSASIKYPYGMAIDAAGNYYFADGGQLQIFKVDPSGIITTFAGVPEWWLSGWEKGDGGPATAAMFQSPMDVAIDRNGDILVADVDDATIRKITRGTHVSGAISVCEGSALTLENSVHGGTWSSSNTSIATVGTGGVVTGVAAGSAVISYTVTNSCNTALATITVNVSAVDGAISASTPMCAATTATFSHDADGGTWSSSNPSVATVGSGSGIVGAVSEGTATITYTFTAACGTAIASRIITVNPLANAGTISGTSSVCIGATVTLSDAITGGTWSSSNTEVATIGTSGTVTGVAGGTATISYSVTNGCGTAVAAMTITVNSIPAAGAITGPTYVCWNTPITLSDTIPGGTWSSSNTELATVGATGIVTGLNTTGNVVITYTVSNDCGSGFATRLITVDPFPVITGPASSVCVGAMLALTSDIPGGVWGGSNPAFATVNTSGIVTGVSASVVNVAYAVCMYYHVVKTITVNALPAVLPIAGPDSVCPGSTITLTNATTGAGSRTWSSSNLATAAVSVAGVVTGISSGTVTISFRYILGCPNYATKVVTVKPVATPTITGTATVCTGGATTTLTATPAGGTWTSGTPAKATIGVSSGTVTSAGVGTSQITYTYDNGNGCITKAYKIVTVNSLPGIGIPSGTGTVCVGAAATLSNAAAGGTWASSEPDVANVGSSSGILTGVGAGTTVITYTITGANGCSAFRTKPVTVNALPSVPDIAGTSWTVCQGSTLAFTESTTGGTYQWIIAPTTVATVNATSGIVRGLTAGTATLSYKYTLGCVNYATAVISVNPATAASITGTAVVCVGNTATLSGAPTGGTWTSSVPAKATVGVSSGIVTGVAGGTTKITYAYTNEYGCSSSSATIATVNSTPGVANIGGMATVCPGATTTLTNAAAGGVWSSANIDVATIGSTSGIVNGIATGTGIVTYVVTGANGCSAQKTKVVTVNALPSVPEITGATFTLCPGGTSVFHDATTGGTHLWIIDPTTVATVTGATSIAGTVNGLTEGTATLSYKYTLGCTNYATAVITVSPAPSVAPIVGPSFIAWAGTITLTDATPGGVWSSSDIGSASVVETGVVWANAPLTTATITYSMPGCSAARATHMVSIGPVARPADNTIAVANISVFPNPTRGGFTVESPVEGTFTIYTIEGKELQGMSVLAGTNTFNLPQGIAAGLYLCRFYGADGSSAMVRLVYE